MIDLLSTPVPVWALVLVIFLLLLIVFLTRKSEGFGNQDITLTGKPRMRYSVKPVVRTAPAENFTKYSPIDSAVEGDDTSEESLAAMLYNENAQYYD